MAEEKKKQLMGDRPFLNSGGVDPYSKHLQKKNVGAREAVGEMMVIPKALGQTAVEGAAGIGNFGNNLFRRGPGYALGAASAGINQNLVGGLTHAKNILSGGAEEVATGAKIAKEGLTAFEENLKKGAAGGEPVTYADPTQDPANIDAQFAEGEKQLAGLTSLTGQNAPTTSDAPAVEALPAGITQLSLGDSPIYKNENLTAEEQKKYGKAIYSDTGIGATPAGFDAQMRESGISTIDTSGDTYNDIDSPRNQAMNILKSLPYGTPGDRQKRRSMLATAQQMLGIGQQDFNQQESSRQFGLDAYKAFKPESQVGRYKTIAGYDIYDEEGIKSGEVPAAIFDSTSGQFTEQEQKKPSLPSKAQAIIDDFKAGADTPERRAAAKAAFDEVMGNLQE